MIEEFLLHLPFRDKGVFYSLLGYMLLFGTFGVRGTIRYFVVGRGTIVRFRLWLDFTCPFEL